MDFGMKRLMFLLLLIGLAVAKPVTSFQGGTEDKVTDRFRVDGPWKLTWDFQGTALQVLIYSDAAGPSAKPVSQAGSGKGSMTVERGGTFWMEIKSVGSYTLRVDTTDAGSSSLPTFEGGMERKGTSVFAAPAGWKFRYSADGVFKATLFDAQRNQVGEPAVILGSGSSERVVGKAGQYFFMIQSTGNYKIEVLK